MIFCRIEGRRSGMTQVVLSPRILCSKTSRSLLDRDFSSRIGSKDHPSSLPARWRRH